MALHTSCFDRQKPGTWQFALAVLTGLGMIRAGRRRCWRCGAAAPASIATCWTVDISDRPVRPANRSLERCAIAHTSAARLSQRPPQRPTRRQLSRATSSMASAVTVTPCSSFQDCDAVAALCGSSFPEEVYSQGLSVQQWAQIEAEDLQNTPSWWRQIGRQGSVVPNKNGTRLGLQRLMRAVRQLEDSKYRSKIGIRRADACNKPHGGGWRRRRLARTLAAPHPSGRQAQGPSDLTTGCPRPAVQASLGMGAPAAACWALLC
jgi:hypothetical protein